MLTLKGAYLNADIPDVPKAYLVSFAPDSEHRDICTTKGVKTKVELLDQREFGAVTEDITDGDVITVGEHVLVLVDSSRLEI